MIMVDFLQSHSKFNQEAYLGPYETSMAELLSEIVISF